MKKLLALVLALVMSMSLVTISSADFKDADKINADYQEAVDVMKAVGVMVGDENDNYNPTANLTREQAAKILAYLELGDKAADALVGSGKFTDLKATYWSAGYVDYCASAGIVAGVGDGKFDPQGQLTALQFGKMLLVEIGYDAKAENMVGTDWAIATGKLMATTGLMDDIDGSVNQVLTREKAAQMALNALKTPTVEYETKGSSISVNGAEINFGASTASYVTNTVAKEQTISKDTLTNSKEYTIELGEKLYKKLVLSDTTDDFGRPTRTWTFENKEVGEYVKEADLEYTAEVEFEDIYADLGLTSAAKITEYYVDGKSESPNATTITKNDDDSVFGDNGVLTQIWYDDDDNTVTVTSVYTYVGKVTAVNKATSSDDRTVTIKGDNDPGTLDKYETEEFAKDDLISYTAAYNKSTKHYEVQSAALLEKSATGVLNKWTGKYSVDSETGNAEKDFTVDGTTYKYSAKACVVDEDENKIDLWKFDVGKTEVDVYLDAYGYALYVAGVEGTTNYATVIGVGSTNAYGDKTTGVTLLLPDGTQKNVTAKLKSTSKALSTGTNLVSDFVGDVVTYTEKDSEYELTVQMTYSTANAGESEFKNGKSEIKLGNNTFYATSETIFMVATNDDDDVDYNVYTGYANMPSFGGTDPITGYAYKTNSSYTKQLDVVYIAAKNVGGISDVDTYFVKEAGAKVYTDSDGAYYVLPAIVDGEQTTVKVDADLIKSKGYQGKDVFVAANNVTKDKNDIITSYKDVTTDADTFAATYDSAAKVAYVTGTVAAGKVVVGLGSKGDKNTAAYWAYNDDTNVYVVNEDFDEITVSNVKSIADDTNDLVYASYDNDEKVLKDIIIIEVNGKSSGDTTINSTEDSEWVSGVASNIYSTGYAQLSMTVKRPDYIATTSNLNYSFDVLVDGVKYEHVTTTSADTYWIAASASSVVCYWNNSGSYPSRPIAQDADITIDNFAFDKSGHNIIVKYYDGETGTELADSKLDRSGSYTTENVSYTTAGELKFKLVSDDASTNKISYTVTGLANGKNITEKKTVTGAANESVQIYGSGSVTVTAAGDQFVVVTIYGLSELNETYDITIDRTHMGTGTSSKTYATDRSSGNATAVAMSVFDVTGADSDTLKVEFKQGTAKKVQNIAAGDSVEMIVTVTFGKGDDRDNGAYDVTVTINGTEYTFENFTATGSKEMNLTVNEDLVVEDVVATATVERLAIASATVGADNKSMTIVFNQPVSKSGNEAISTSDFTYSGSSGNSIMSVVTVNDTTVKLIFQSALSAGQTVAASSTSLLGSGITGNIVLNSKDVATVPTLTEKKDCTIN